MYLNKSFFEIENSTIEYSQANKSGSKGMAGWKKQKKKYLILFQVLMLHASQNDHTVVRNSNKKGRD